MFDSNELHFEFHVHKFSIKKLFFSIHNRCVTRMPLMTQLVGCSQVDSGGMATDAALDAFVTGMAVTTDDEIKDL